MRTVLFQDSKREHARSTRLLDRFGEVTRGEFFPRTVRFCAVAKLTINKTSK